MALARVFEDLKVNHLARKKLPENPVKQRHCQGAFMIEVLVALFVITVGMVGLAKLHSNLIKSSHHAQQVREGQHFAQSRMDVLMSMQHDYDNIASGTETKTGQSASYTVTWTVTETAVPAYKTLGVVSSWTDSSGDSQSVQLTGQVSKLYSH